MSIFTITLIAISLALDCLAITISIGSSIRQNRLNNAFKIALSFGGFQAIMPLIGWFGGQRLVDLISGFDHWVAFGILALIGLKMIYESTKLDDEDKKYSSLSLYLLLLLSIATSIDALAIGLSFAFLQIYIITPILIIGFTTFLFSFLGFFIGSKLGHFFENKMELVGGVVLIGIGVKILLEHLGIF